MVTGASSGIGRSIAKRLAADGLRVAFCARRFDRLASLAAEIEEAGGAALPIECDLRDVDAIDAMFENVRDEWGGVDVLVNNAGFGENESLMEGDHEVWRAMLQVNVLALSICTREAVRDMQRRETDGHIIHISSMSAHRVPPGSGMYSATKYAVRSLTEGLRKELAAIQSPIRVTAISPGFVETEFAENYHRSADTAAEIYSRFRVLDREDIADACAYVLSAPPHVQVHDILMRPAMQPS